MPHLIGRIPRTLQALKKVGTESARSRFHWLPSSRLPGTGQAHEIISQWFSNRWVAALREPEV